MQENRRERRLYRGWQERLTMTDADRFRALAAQCAALGREAKRSDVREALRCLARDYAAEAEGAAAPAAQLPLAWPMLTIQRQIAGLMRLSCAFWLPL
jgi:hypothetical protein